MRQARSVSDGMGQLRKITSVAGLPSDNELAYPPPTSASAACPRAPRPPLSLVDSDGKPYADGANKYVLRFGKEQLPLVNAFWWVTLYDKDSYLVPTGSTATRPANAANRRINDDRSFTILIQSDSPGSGEKPTGCRATTQRTPLELRSRGRPLPPGLTPRCLKSLSILSSPAAGRLRTCSVPRRLE